MSGDQPDPLGLVDGASRYAYVNNDPLQKVYPEGLSDNDIRVFILPDGSPEFDPPFNDPLAGSVCSIANPPFIYYVEVRPYSKFELAIEILRLVSRFQKI